MRFAFVLLLLWHYLWFSFTLAFPNQLKMSNTDAMPTDSEPQASATVDQLASALAENVNISSATAIDKENPSSTTTPEPKSVDEAISQGDTQVKNVIPAPDTSKPSTSTEFHLIKWIEFNYELLPILLQNVNGPCPLLALFNILLLRKRVKCRPALIFCTWHLLFSPS